MAKKGLGIPKRKNGNLAKAQAVSLHRRGGYVEDYIRFDGSLNGSATSCQWIFDSGDFCGRDVLIGARFPYCRIHFPRAVTVCASRAIEDWIDKVLTNTGTVEPQEL